MAFSYLSKNEMKLDKILYILLGNREAGTQLNLSHYFYNDK
jgi:hypothetical protein